MKTTIQSFYQAFSELDSEGMTKLYHDKVRFEDPAFGVLEGERAKEMWRMLCKSQEGKDFQVVYSDISGDEKTARAHWEAKYTFSQTGRKVHNKIEASFEFADGKIIKHTDVFPLYTWSKQALGWKGALMGWTPFFKKQLQAQTNRLLDKWIAKKG